MDYTEARECIRRFQTGAKIKPGLAVTRALMRHLGDPQDRLPFVHVAGTNGKGSTAAFISAIYAGQGLRVGRYVSPAVFSELEIIQCACGDEIVYVTEEEMAECLTRICEVVREMNRLGEGIPTEFEVETAAAFLMFDRWHCDLVVLEAGMGGRRDATNVIRTTECAVVTPISLDHERFLGHTVEAVTAEKAGILRRQIPAVTYQHDSRAEAGLREVSRELPCELRTVSEKQIRILDSSARGTRFDYGGYRNLAISQAGLYQVENACLAVECAKTLRGRFPVSEEDIRRGLAGARWRGRFEVIHTGPTVVADGAHNPDGIGRFLESVRAYYGEREKIAVMGVFADKDYVRMADQITETFQKIYAVTPPSERGLPAEELAAQFPGRAVVCASVQEALASALAPCGGEPVIFVFGSLSLMRGAYGALNESEGRRQ